MISQIKQDSQPIVASKEEPGILDKTEEDSKPSEANKNEDLNSEVTNESTTVDEVDSKPEDSKQENEPDPDGI